MLKLLISIVFSLSSFCLYSTTFVPISIKAQIEEANSIVYGELISREFHELDDGMIATKFIIRADKWMGFKIEAKSKLVEIYSLGGETEDRVMEVEGSAKISVGEKVVLFLGEDDQGRKWIKNLGLGKYSAKKVGDQMVLVNQVFPMHPEMGQIRLSHFIELAERLKEAKFVTRFMDKYEIQRLKQTKYKSKISTGGRSIASVAEEKHLPNRLSSIWLVILLGVLGGGIAVIRRKNQE